MHSLIGFILGCIPTSNYEDAIKKVSAPREAKLDKVIKVLHQIGNRDSKKAIVRNFSD